MKITRLTAVVVAAFALSGVAAPVASAAQPDLMWVVKCVGDSLGGNSCHQ